MDPNKFYYPKPGILGATLSAIANSRLLGSVRRAILSHLPFVRLESDVRDIVYLNWVVPSELVRAHIPRGVQILEVGGATILTTLTYSHGGFGPSIFGRLRRFFPSPLQSNWRLYVSEASSGVGAAKKVLFLKNIFNSIIYAVGTRVFSDALPSHMAPDFKHHKQGNHYITEIKAGQGSAPELSCITEGAEAKELPSEFQRFFASWEEAIEYLCIQDSAICGVPGINRIAQAGIDLPIDTSLVVPLKAVDYTAGAYLESLGADSIPFCFAVPRVKFKVLWERLLPDLSSHHEEVKIDSVQITNVQDVDE